MAAAAAAATKAGFWASAVARARAENRALVCLAPMHEVTTCSYRELVCRLGAPDVVFTEFVSVAGLSSAAGREGLLPMLRFTARQRPVVAQLFGTDPAQFRSAAALVRELGFDGVDLNMGCAVRAVCKPGAGAALMRTPALAQAIVRATQCGAGDLPVSVKTRVGYDSVHLLDAWLSALLEVRPAAITLHWRTHHEQSAVPAHWELARRAVELAAGSGVLLLGNGDVQSVAHGLALAREHGLDGVMIGRAAIGNPWLFAAPAAAPRTVEDVLGALLEHARLHWEFCCPSDFARPRLASLVRHWVKYFRGFPGARLSAVAISEAHRSGRLNSLDSIEAVIGELRTLLATAAGTSGV